MTLRLFALTLATATALTACGGGGSNSPASSAESSGSVGASDTLKVGLAVVSAQPVEKPTLDAATTVWRISSDHVESGVPVTASSGETAFHAWFSGTQYHERLNTATFKPTTGWTVTPITIPEGSPYLFNTAQLSMSANTSGEAVVAWAEADFGNAGSSQPISRWQIRISRYINGVWAQPETVGESGRYIDQVRVSCPEQGTPVVAWMTQQYADDAGIVVASTLSAATRRADGNWRTSVVRSLPSGWITEMQAIQGGKTTSIAWIESVGSTSALKISSSPDGQFSAENVLASTPSGPMNGLQIASSNGGITAVWRQRRCDASLYPSLPVLIDEWAQVADQQLCAASQHDGAWAFQLIGPNAGGYTYAFRAAIATQPSGKLLVAWSEGLAAQRRVWVNTRDAAGTWSTQTSLDTPNTLTPSAVAATAMNDDHFAVAWVAQGNAHSSVTYDHIAIASLDDSGRGIWTSDTVSRWPLLPALARAGNALVLTWRSPMFTTNLFAQDVADL